MHNRSTRTVSMKPFPSSMKGSVCLPRNRRSFVVCGGSSLIARGYVSRVTRDVDVVARRVRGTGLVSARPLPPACWRRRSEWLRTSAYHPLLNDGPAIFRNGFARRFRRPAAIRSYGTHLNIWFIDRIDQIYFKLYAAADQGPASTWRSDGCIPPVMNCSGRSLAFHTMCRRGSAKL